jgi:transposase
MMQERGFTKEFEEEAVGLVQASGRTQRKIAGDLGIGLVRWIGRSRDRRAADPTAAAEDDVTAGLKELRWENEILRQERDILKPHSPLQPPRNTGFTGNCQLLDVSRRHTALIGPVRGRAQPHMGAGNEAGACGVW